MNAKTVLLVEDNEDSATIYGVFLEHHGFRVLRARDGAEGVRLAHELHPDLILMDVSIRPLSGWDAMRQIRANRCTADIPALALTEYGELEMREQAELAGFQALLEKPCAPRRLLLEVRQHLDGVHATAA